MSDQVVSIIRLDPVNCVCAWAFSNSPEEAAWRLLKEWAEPLGLLQEGSAARIFGYNNPNPSVGSPNYGYEYLLTVQFEMKLDKGLKMKTLSGGLYAVMPFTGDFSIPWESIPAAWQELDAWVASNGYNSGSHQCLEEHSHNGILINLYYPISE